jgi:hypothetical protein
MRRPALGFTASAVVIMLLGAGQVRAQVPGAPTPGPRPTYSPYLNLFRQGQPLYQNYYGLVRPQVQFENSVNRLQQQVTSNREALSQQEEANINPELRPTGHPFSYFSHQGFFLNNTRGGGGGAPGSRPGSGTSTARPSASTGGSRTPPIASGGSARRY